MANAIDMADGSHLGLGEVATAITTDGNYPSASGVGYPGPEWEFACTGTFDGATFTLQTKTTGHSNWRDVIAFTAANARLLDIVDGDSLRVTVTDDGASTSVQSTLTEKRGNHQ